MPELVFRGQQYRLRAGTPMPVAGAGNFVLHTFMAERSQVDIFACTERLPRSREFRGQGGNLMSANFSRLNVKGGNIFSGKVVYAPEYVDEDVI
jgi:hypothetical protein